MINTSYRDPKFMPQTSPQNTLGGEYVIGECLLLPIGYCDGHQI